MAGGGAASFGGFPTAPDANSGGTVTSVTGTPPITSTGGTTPAIGITPATTLAAGSMSAADKTKLDALPAALSLPVSVANGGTGSATGSAAGLNNIPAGQLTGDVAVARIATALAVGGNPITGTVLTASTRVDAPSIGTSSGNQHALPSGTDDILTADSTAIVTSKSMSGASNTFTNLPGPDWGDGSDGAQVISGTTTLTQSLHATTLVVQSGGVLNTGNCAVYATTSIVVQSGGIIQNNGNAASGATAGAITTARQYIQGSAGGNGQTGAGTNGNASARAIGGAGGNGGAGTSGAGGAGGAATAPVDPAAQKSTFSREFFFVGANALSPGAGGAGGGGNGASAGGGGGAGGGIAMLKSPLIQVDAGGTIRANGGAGANGTASNTGGGGGGGGGGVSLIYRSYTNGGTVQAAGGAKGLSGGGSGVDGVDGSAGVVLTRQLP